MFQPENPNIWTSGNRSIENLVSRGGGLTWNPETQQWERFWEQESYRDPQTNTLFDYNPVLERWFQVANQGVIKSGPVQRRAAKAESKEESPAGFGLPADFMDYITGNYLTKG